MKSFIANTIVKWFKRLPFAGRQRFWMLYWAYRLTGWHIRSHEWDFVLEYLPPLGKWQKVRILDVGCAKSLLAYELLSRKYDYDGIDIDDTQIFIPKYRFTKSDIRINNLDKFLFTDYDFISCISVFEHIEGENGQKDALNNMINCLKVGGRLLLTIPTHEFAQGHPWHGFNFEDVLKIAPINSRLLEYTERAGQLCLCIGRIA